MQAEKMFKYAHYDLIVEDNGNLKYVKKDGLGNQEVIKFIVGGFQIIYVYYEEINGKKLPYEVTLNGILVQAINEQMKELGWWSL
ncbi:MAG: hypothetical protein PHH31_09220 [Acidaminococcaceae bacterium]|nr:hypothetical protein [Acidaminococcaceae bacterium]